MVRRIRANLVPSAAQRAGIQIILFRSRADFAHGTAQPRFRWHLRVDSPGVAAEGGVTPVRDDPGCNFEIWSGQDTFYVINDNEGRLFGFEKLAQGETWVTREALERSAIDNPVFAAGSTGFRALASVKPTDVLVLGIRAWPAGITAMPLRVEGRAALYSLGFILRRAASVRLDIHERELKVGMRVLRTPMDKSSDKSSFGQPRERRWVQLLLRESAGGREAAALRYG